MKNQEKPRLTLLSTQAPAKERRGDEKPELLIDAAHYPRAAPDQIRDLLASDPCIVERGTPMKVPTAAPSASRRTAHVARRHPIGRIHADAAY
jgi:hypothetical protein